MPEEKATINEGSADLSGPDKATKERISESILARAKKKASKLKENVKDNFSVSPRETLSKNFKKDGLEGQADRNNQKRALGNSVEGIGDDPKNVNQEVPDKFGEGRKQYIQSLEMKKRKKIQAGREKKSSSGGRSQSLIRQMGSFQANKDAILRDGISSIREGDNSSKDKNDNLEENGASGSSDQSKEANLKSAKQNDKGKLDAKLDAKVAINQTGKNKIPKIKLATDRFLKAMIENVLETFTLSAFYVYIHVFLHQIFPNYFSELGHEWVPDNIKKTSPDKAKEIGNKIGIIEKPATGCCCLFHLVVIIIICAIIYFMVNWGEVAWEWFKGLFS